MVNRFYNKNYRKKSFTGGYRQFRNPTIFRAKKIKPKKEFKLPKIPFKFLLYATSILVLIYLLFFSNKFRIQDVIVEGNKMVSSEKILSQVPKNKNIFLFSVSKTKKEILKNNPEIKNLEIYRGIPNAIKVVVLEREGKILWQSGDSVYLISTQGEVAKKIQPGENFDYPLIVDKKNIPVEVGSNLLSPSFVAFITNINTQFFSVTNIKLKNFEVDETTFDVNAVTEAGFYVKFNSLRSSAKQLENLKNVLVQKRDQIHEYIDLRVDGWAYYK